MAPPRTVRGVDDHPVQPAHESAIASKPGELRRQQHADVLGNFGRLLRIAQHPQAEPTNARVVPFDQLGERSRIARRGPVGQDLVRVHTVTDGCMKYTLNTSMTTFSP